VLTGRREPLAIVLTLVGAQLYLLLAGDLLPARQNPSDAALIAGSVGICVVVAAAAAIVPLGDEPVLLALAAFGAGVLAVALAAADVGAQASVAEAVAYAAVGSLFAIATQTPALVLVLPLFVGAVDFGSGLIGGGEAVGLVMTGDPAGDLLAMAVPGWEGRPDPARLGIAEAVFLGVFLTYARRFGLRPLSVIAGCASWMVAVFALELRQDVVVPAVPVLALVLFAVNLDQLRALSRLARDG